MSSRLRYDADVETVHAMLVDPTFQARVCEATGALKHEVDVTGSGGSAVVTTRRTMPTDQVPDVVRRFVGSTLDVVRTDTWTSARTADVEVEISGAPVRLRGTLTLEPDGDGTKQTVEGDLKAALPLFGGKIEKATEPAITAALATEEKVGRGWLAGERT